MDNNIFIKKNTSYFEQTAFITFIAIASFGVLIHSVILLQLPEISNRVLYSFSLGIGYDLMNAALIAMMGLCFIFLPEKVYRSVHLILIFSTFLFIFLDYQYLLQFGTHLPFTTLEYLDEAGSFSATIISILISWSFLLLFLLPIIFFSLFFFLIPISDIGFKQLSFTSLFLIIIGGISGSYSNSDYTKNVMDPLSMAGINYFYFTKDQEKEVYIERPVEDLKEVQKLLFGAPSDNPKFKDYPFVREHSTSSCQNSSENTDLAKLLCQIKVQQPNILLIMLESFRASEIGIYGSQKKITPFFDQWSQRGILFKNFFANGFQTRHGQVATYCSIMPNYGIPIMKGYANNHFYCLPHELKKKNYHTSWFFGSDAAFDGQIKFLPKIGFDEIVDQYAFPADSEKLGWGYSDQALFNLWLERLDKMSEPFFSSALTITNHHPFDVPAQYKLGEGQDYQHKYYEAVHYTDAVLGEFLEKIQKKPWYQNSLIIIIADTANCQEPQSPPANFDQWIRHRSQIPLLLIGGVIQQSLVVEDYASQIDLAPTILDLMKIPYTAPWVGRSLIDSKKPFMAYTNRPNNYWGVMSSAGQYYRQSNQEEHLFGSKDLTLKQTFSKIGQAWINSTKWLLQEDKYWTP